MIVLILAPTMTTHHFTRSKLILPEEFWEETDNPPEIKTLIHQRLAVALQKGRIPWQVPLLIDPNAGRPCNVRTLGRYRGVNTLLLCDTFCTKGYHSKWWGTAEDWESVGATVKNGQRPTVIAHYPEIGYDIKPCQVYNVAQVKGADQFRVAKRTDMVVPSEEVDYGYMGMMMEHHAPDIRFNSDKEQEQQQLPIWNGKYFAPEPWHSFPKQNMGDFILMKSENHFRSKSDFYSVMLHEFVHWAEVRTEWFHCLPVREFVAEAGMHILGMELGIPYFIDAYSHHTWLAHWKVIFPQDETFFFWAMSQVDRVCDYLLGPVLHLEPEDYHDHYRIEPEINHLNGPDMMSFQEVL